MAARIEGGPTAASEDEAGPPSFLRVGQGAAERRIAYRSAAGHDPSVFWLGGFRSDMRGTKAERLAGFARRSGFSFCRFDYSGHGESGGRFEDGTLSRWLEEADAVLTQSGSERFILVGSSMGAWIALRLVQELRKRGAGAQVVGLLLIAPAADFTQRLVEPRLSADQRRALARDGFCTEPSAYGQAATVFTRALLEDGAHHTVMDRVIETGCPVHIIQGMADTDVPFTHALDLVSHLPADGVILTLIQGGDHRLSRDGDLQRIEQALGDLVASASRSLLVPASES